MKGKLTVVGFGPGSKGDMTLRAVEAIEKADVVTGFTTYIKILKEFFPDKEYKSNGMTKEVDRCRMAVEDASKGLNVAMVSSGDSGIYGMASPVLELAGEYGVEVEIIPGVTAAASGAALLGSPITADFSVISLSDLLTPMEKIEKRLEGAAMSDQCIVIYNPSSRKRSDHLKRACEIVLRYQSPETVCGIAKNIGREGESCTVLTLAELADTPTDMFTTVFIGNSSTKVIDGKMVTPRGYRNE